MGDGWRTPPTSRDDRKSTFARLPMRRAAASGRYRSMAVSFRHGAARRKGTVLGRGGQTHDGGARRSEGDNAAAGWARGVVRHPYSAAVWMSIRAGNSLMRIQKIISS